MNLADKPPIVVEFLEWLEAHPNTRLSDLPSKYKDARQICWEDGLVESSSKSWAADATDAEKINQHRQTLDPSYDLTRSGRYALAMRRVSGPTTASVDELEYRDMKQSGKPILYANYLRDSEEWPNVKNQKYLTKKATEGKVRRTKIDGKWAYRYDDVDALRCAFENKRDSG